MDVEEEDDPLPTVEDFTGPHLSTYTPVPEIQPGVCDVCHGATTTAWNGEPWPRCWSCKQTVGGVSHPVELVVPISLYRVTEQLHTVLADYKRSRDPRVRERHLWQVAAILHRFLFGHRNHVAAAARRYWDTVTIVPSKVGNHPHPLEAAIMLGKPLRDEYARLLEPADVDAVKHNQSSDDGYRATNTAAGRTVLLIDDTFTTGASLQSAASALAHGGAHVVGAVVIGRVIDTGQSDRYPEKLELWQQQCAIPFSFGTCCLE